MAEQHKITNANDIVLNFAGAQTGGIGALLCSDFNFSESNDDSLLHGVGNNKPIGNSEGNSTYEFDITLQGENADAANSVFESADSRPDISMYAISDNGSMTWRVPHAWPQDSEYSGSDGDPVELSVQGHCLEPVRSG